MPLIIAAGITAATTAATSATSNGKPGGVGGAQLPPNVPTSYSQDTTLPDSYTHQQEINLQKLNADADSAASIAEGNPTPYAPFLGEAENEIGYGRNTLGHTVNPGLDQDVFQSYMDPYTEGVVNQIQTLGNRNLMENVLPGVNNTFTSAGQFGSDRNGDFENRAIRDTQQAELGAEAGALEHGFDTSMAGYNAGEGRTQTAAGLYNQLANTAISAGNAESVDQLRSEQGLLYPGISVAQATNSMQVPTSIKGTGSAPLPGATYGPSAASQLGSAASGLAGALNQPGSPASGTNPSIGGTSGSYGTVNDVPVVGTIKRGGSIDTAKMRQKAAKKKRGGALALCDA